MNLEDTDNAEDRKADDVEAARHDHDAVAVDSPGRALAAARRAKKLEIVRIGTELRLKPETIDALERDDFDHLPSPVFVSGYIRTYARLLDIDPKPLIARFYELHPGAEAPPRSAVENQELARAGSGWTVPLMLAGVLLVGGGGYLWWTSGGLGPSETVVSSDLPDQNAPGAEVGDDAVDAEQVDETADGMVNGPEPVVLESDAVPVDRPLADLTAIESAAPVDDNLVSGAEPADEETALELISRLKSDAELSQPGSGNDAGADLLAPESEEANAATSDSNQVEVSFAGPCWVDIRDASGEVQLFGEMADGDQHILGGAPPFSLVIGNASAVTMSVGGKPFDLGAIAKGNVARFKLDPATIVSADTPPDADRSGDASAGSTEN